MQEKFDIFEALSKRTPNNNIYGDRRSSQLGDTVADLGGGNTAVTPDTQTASTHNWRWRISWPGSHGRSNSGYGWNSWDQQQVLDCLLSWWYGWQQGLRSIGYSHHLVRLQEML